MIRFDLYRLTIQLVGVVLAMVLLSAFYGCATPKIVTVTEVKTEEHTIIDYAHDTLIVRDSVYIRERGDTIFVNRWHTRDRVLEVCRVDSFVRVDSIPYPVEVVREVRVRNAYDKFTARGFWILLILIVAVVAIWIGSKTPQGKAIMTAIRIFCKL